MCTKLLAGAPEARSCLKDRPQLCMDNLDLKGKRSIILTLERLRKTQTPVRDSHACERDVA